MRSLFTLPGQDNWTFRLVLLGGRMQLEGESGELRCNAWLSPQESPLETAYQLIRRPSCCLMADEAGMIAA